MVDSKERGVNPLPMESFDQISTLPELIWVIDEPVDPYRQIAFKIILGCDLAEEEGGKQLRAEVLGLLVGRLERNILYERSCQKDDRWEPKVLAYLCGEMKEARESEHGGIYDEKRENVLYGTWNEPDLLGRYVYLVNIRARNKIAPILDDWFEEYLVPLADNVVSGN